MADGVRVLGLAVDASSAIRDTKALSAELGFAGARSRATADDIRAVDEAMAKMAASASRAASSAGSVAASEAREAEVLAELRAGLSAAKKEIDAMAGSQGAMGQGVQQSALHLGRLQSSLISVTGHLSGTSQETRVLNGALTALVGSGGSGVLVAVAATAAVAGATYEHYTVQTRELKKAQDEATASLIKWDAEQRAGVDGDFVEKIRLANQELPKLQKNLQQAASDLYLLNSQKLIGGGIFDFLAQLAGLDLGTAATKYAKAAQAIQDANEKVANEVAKDTARSKATQEEALAALIKNGQETTAQRATAVTDLARDSARLEELNQAATKSLVFAKSSEDERSTLKGQVTALTEALAGPKVKEAIDHLASLRSQVTAYIDEAANFGKEDSIEKRTSSIISALYQMEKKYPKLTAEIESLKTSALAAGDALEKAQGAEAAQKIIDAQNKVTAALHDKTLATLTELEAIKSGASTRVTYAADLAYQRDLQEANNIADTDARESRVKEVEANHDANVELAKRKELLAALADLHGADPFDIPGAAEKEKKAAEERIRNLQEALNIARQIGDALSQSGSAGVRSLGQALQVGSAAGSIGLGIASGDPRAVVSGVSDLIGAIDLFGTHASAITRQLKADAEALAASYKVSFNAFVDAGKSISPEDQIHSDAQKLRDSLLAQYTVQDGPLKGQIVLAGQYAAAIAQVNAAEAARIQALHDGNAVTAQHFAESNGVLALRVQGLGAEADAMQTQLDIQAKVDAATKQYGDTAEVARYRTLLLAEANNKAAAAADAAAKAAADKAEQDRRSRFDLTNGARGFTDARGANQAAFEENQARRLADASDKAAAALYNTAEAAQRVADLQAADLSTSRSLAARLLTAGGNTRGAEDVNRLNSQTQELAAAIRDEMSPTNLALLQYTQFAESAAVVMQRTIEDGTKALTEEAAKQTAAVDQQIADTRVQAAETAKRFDDQIAGVRAQAVLDAKFYDAQIKAAQDSTKAQLAALDVQASNARTSQQLAKDTLAATQQSVAKLTQVKDSLDQFAGSLALGDLSTLTPAQKLAEAQRQFDTLVSAARSGDTSAAGGVGSAASALLSQSRAFNGSTTAYGATFDAVRATVAALQGQYGGLLGGANGQLGGAQAMSDAADAQLAAIQAQRDAVTTAGDATVTALQKLKDQNAADRAAEIDMLQQFKDAAAQGASDQLDALSAMKDAIAGRLQDSITELTSNARQTYQAQVDFYATSHGLMGQQLTAQNAQVTVLQSGFTVMQAQIDALIVAVNENTASTKRAVQESTA